VNSALNANYRSVVMGESIRAQRYELAEALRADGRMWVEVAEELRARWPELGARAAMRIAHRWTQRDAAREWSSRWPDHPKESRDISLWELWPGQTGRRPSLDSLDKLAQLYECSIGDLLTDISDYRHLDGGPAGGKQGTSDLSGVWYSRYRYGGEEDQQGEHYVVVRQHGEHLVAESLPHSQQSRLKLDMTFYPPTTTGTWTERTSPTGRYKGAHFYGSIQLMVDPSGRSMSGKWVGFGRSFKINTGDWELRWADGETTAAALAEYHLKV
jgi:hypothetical protein